jgi:hypothetical protein
MRHMVSNSTKRTIHKLHDGGLDPLDIAVTIALSPDTIYRLIQEYEATDDYADLFCDEPFTDEMD